MSAPTPASGDGSPAPGYYPDPSIPGYVRYWNGAAWVPGTSRPTPSGAGVAAVPRATPAPPAVEETGPVFFDEEPLADAAQEPASAWQADVSRQSGFGGERDHRVSWGAPGEDPRIPAPASPPAEMPADLQADAVRAGRHAGGPGGDSVVPGPVTGRGVEPVGTERRSEPVVAEARAKEQDTVAPPRGGAAIAAPPPRSSSPRTVRPTSPAPAHAPAAPAGRPAPVAAEPPVVPWKPPTEDPFVRAARTQAAARPGAPGKRLLARLVDSLVLAALVGPPAWLVLDRVRTHIDEKVAAAKQTGRTVTVWLLDGTTAGYAGALVVAMLLIGVLYEVLPTVRWGRTLGKALCGLEVRGIESQERPGFGAALSRWLVYGVLGLLAVGVLNVLWCLVDRPWRQCWHDKVAHTFVARRVRA